jgi:hypothetical protein
MRHSSKTMSRSVETMRLLQDKMRLLEDKMAHSVDKTTRPRVEAPQVADLPHLSPNTQRQRHASLPRCRDPQRLAA